MRQLGHLWAHILTAIRPATGEDVTLGLPAVDAAAMQALLDHVAASRPPDAHVVMVLDGAGRHVGRALAAPPTITLVVLPPPDRVRGRLCSPELDPVERVRLHPRERFLSPRIPRSTDAILDARRDARRDARMRLVAEHDRLRPLRTHPRIEKAAS